MAVAPEMKKRSRLSLFFWIFIPLLALSFISVILIPTIISTAWGKERLISWINQSIPGEVRVDQLSLSWLGPQSAQGVTLRDENNEIILSLDTLSSEAPLIHFTSTGSLEFQALNAVVIGDEDGKLNLLKALDRKCCSGTSQGKAEPFAILLKNVRGKVGHASSKHSFFLQVSGETQKEQVNGTFDIDAEMNGIDFFEITHRDQNFVDFLHSRPEAELKIHADIHHFPIALIDQFLAAKSPKFAGLLTEALGNELNLKIDQTKAAEGMIFHLLADSTTLSSEADIIINHEIKLTKPAKISLRTTPLLAEKIFKLFNLPTVWRLDREAIADLTISELQVPFEAFHSPAFDGQAISLAAALNLNNVSMTVPGSGRTVKIEKFHAEASSEKDSKRVSLALDSHALFEGQSTAINVSVTLPKAFVLGKWSGLTLQEIALNGAITGAPIFVADRFWEWIVPPSQILGPIADVAFSISHPEDRSENRLLASLEFKSSQLEIPLLSFWIDTHATLQKPAQIVLRVGQEFVNNAIAASGAWMEAPATIQFMINSLSLPISEISSPMKAVYQGLDAQMKATSIRFANLPRVGAVSFNDFSGRFKGDPKTQPEVTASFSIEPFSQTAFTGFIRHGSPLEVTIDPSHIPLTMKDLSLLKLQGKVKVREFELAQKMQNRPLAAIDNLIADWSIDAGAKLFSLNFIGSTRLGEGQATGKIDGSLEVSKWIRDGSLDLSQAVVEIKANASKMPVDILGALSGQKDLVPILGSSLDLTMEALVPLASDTANGQGIVSLKVNSENLSGGIALSIGELIQLSHQRPAEFKLKLDPHGYSALRRRIHENDAGNFILLQPAVATLKLDSLYLPRSTSFLNSGIEGEFSIANATGMDTKEKNTISFDHIQGHLSSQNLAENIDFRLQAKGHTGQGQNTSWNVLGSLNKGFSPDGSINRKDLSLSLDATVNALPVPLLCQFICLEPGLKQKIQAVFGSKIDAKIQAKLHRMNGPLFADVKGENGWFTIDGTITDALMTLNRDLTAQLIITPELSQSIFEEFIPVLGGMISAEHPIGLAISREGFKLPLQNPSAQGIAIGSAVLDLGKVRFSSDSQIAKVFSLLASSSTDLLVWVTPAYFSLRQGTLTLQRTDMLISDRYPIAAWGTVDLVKDRVNMIIGLTGSAISKAFHVSEIPNSYLLQLPLKGKLNSPSIDKAKAGARLTALVAHSQGNPHGMVIGTVIDIATGGLTEEAAPLPTTRPLPWEELLKDSEKKNSAEKTAKSKEGEKTNPIEEIGKGASSLIKKLFR